MEQRSIVLSLARKGLQSLDIHRDLVATLGPEAVSYSRSLAMPITADDRRI
jgi:hypothetical protein